MSLFNCNFEGLLFPEERKHNKTKHKKILHVFKLIWIISETEWSFKMLFT